MPFSRSQKNSDHPFTQISNYLINDKRLSFQAIGLLTYLLSKPDYWYINTDDLIRSHSNNRFSIRSIIKELISYGYLVKSQLRYDNGKFSSYFYLLIEDPLKTTTSPECGFPTAVKPTAVKPTAVKRTTVNNKNKIIQEKKTTTSPTKVVNTKKEVVNPDYLKKKEKCLDICNSFNVIDPVRLIKKYGLNDFYDYAILLKNSNSTIPNPTGWIVAGIKEKWKKLKPLPKKPLKTVQQTLCPICDKWFYYMNFKPSQKYCPTCLEKKL